MAEMIIGESVTDPQPLTVNDLFPSRRPPVPDVEGSFFDEGTVNRKLDEDYLEGCHQRRRARAEVLQEEHRRAWELQKAAEYEGLTVEAYCYREGLPLDKSSKKGKRVPAEHRSVIEVYERDIKVRKRILSKEVKDRRKGKPGRRIVAFSKASRRNMKFKLRNVNLGKKPFILTLTYPSIFPTSGKEVKAHWDLMRRWLTYRNLSGFWFLEFQKRGAPHIHVLLTGYVSPEKVKKHWIKVIKASPEDVERINAYSRNGAHVEIVRDAERVQVSYACKYAAKAEQKEVPAEFHDVGRFWGFFGGLTLTVLLEWGAQESDIAYYVRVIKNMEKANRRRWGGKPRKYPGNGRCGFTAYSVGKAFCTNWTWPS